MGAAAAVKLGKISREAYECVFSRQQISEGKEGTNAKGSKTNIRAERLNCSGQTES